MKQKTNSKRYIFDAHAVGVAGQISHPFSDVIGVQAGSTLPATGGFGSARVDGFRYREILSFASAHTEVLGSETQPGIFETVSLSVIEGFNLLGVVTCDRIVARVSGKHPGNDRGESCIVPAGSHFERLRIGNTFFERLEIAPEYFCRPDRACWSGLMQGLGNEREREALASLSLPAPNGSAVPLPRPEQASVLGFSIALGEGGRPVGVFEVPQFGTVHLGEFFCYPTARHLIMLRADLGCPVQGDVSTGEAIVDGGGYPPS